jgi:Ni,Fe-hydrogenase I large subunit
MKKLLFTSLLGFGLLLPASFSASTNTTASTTEFSSKKPKKSKTQKARKSRSKSSRSSYSQSKGCNYNGNSLSVGPRGGCYYYSGSSKVYVDRSYCSGCN